MAPGTLSLLYFNKTLLHRSSARSSLITGPVLSSSPLEAKNPGGVFYGSTTTFHLGGSPWVLHDKLKMLRALVLCLVLANTFSAVFY